SAIEWQELKPDQKYTWLTEGMHSEFTDFIALGTKEAKVSQIYNAQTIFKTYSLGVATGCDEWTFSFDKNHLTEKIQRFIRNYNSEVYRWMQEGSSFSQ